ncbi:MAG: isoprenylcysteine carboxylmethyltransferase family protein [Dehalococcoidia bacterium]|nr:isoprenylcysteine carboxylmethyltransferase family protein [Dehalococcoidia bacterium]
MLAETGVAFVLLAFLVCFFSVNLRNILKGRRGRLDLKEHPEGRRPSGLFISLAMLGTLAYFVAVFAHLFLVFSGTILELYRFPYHFRSPPTVHMQIPGLVLTAAGYGIFIWSVIARGMYAVSWEMPEDQRLVTWGPYALVRHPSYLGYFLMFSGLFLLWPNFLTALSLVAIPAYYRLTFDEEELLVQHFGQEYVEYRKKAGRVIPGF